MPTEVSFYVELANGSSHTIRCQVELDRYDTCHERHEVTFLDLAHVRDLVDTHGLTSRDLEAFETKAVEVFELKMRAAKLVQLEDVKESA